MKSWEWPIVNSWGQYEALGHITDAQSLGLFMIPYHVYGNKGVNYASCLMLPLAVIQVSL